MKNSNKKLKLVPATKKPGQSACMGCYYLSGNIDCGNADKSDKLPCIVKNMIYVKE